jgi:hypothetical protein
MGGKSNAALVNVVTIGVIILLILLFLWWNCSRTQDSWFVDVSVSPLGAGSVSPSGNVSVAVNQSRMFEASAAAGYSFLNWVFDGRNLGSQPQLSLPSQTVNFSHILIAVFEHDAWNPNNYFEILPDKQFVVGSSNFFDLFIKSNDTAVNSEIRVKLNDPYGVFSSFTVQNQGEYNRTFDSVLNTWLNGWGLNDYLWDPHTASSLVLAANSQEAFPCASIVNPNIAPGVYHLSWDIRSTFLYPVGGVVGSILYPAIPWSVTIL